MSISNLFEHAKKSDDSALKALVEKIESSVYVKDVIYAVERAWLDRADAQFGKNPKRSAAYVKAEIEFMCGAMAAMQVLLPGQDSKLSPLITPKWPVSIMTGRPLVDPKEHGRPA